MLIFWARRLRWVNVNNHTSPLPLFKCLNKFKVCLNNQKWKHYHCNDLLDSNHCASLLIIAENPRPVFIWKLFFLYFFKRNFIRDFSQQHWSLYRLLTSDHSWNSYGDATKWVNRQLCEWQEYKKMRSSTSATSRAHPTWSSSLGIPPSE